MTAAEWHAALVPKVHGSWNLHTTLPLGMDFFIMLSSAVCIFGNIGQANYAAGNSFQDALARYRAGLGERAVAINLGMVLGEGWVAERKHVQHRVMQLDHVLPMSQADLFAILDYYCHPQAPPQSSKASQIITGLQLPALALAAGRQVPDCLMRLLFRAMFQVIPVDNPQATTASTTAARDTDQDFAAVFHAAPTLVATGEAVAEALKRKLCKILDLDEKLKSVNDSIGMFGVDSLIALEIRNWLSKTANVDLAVYEMLGDVKLIETGIMVAKRSERW
ncbi:hypothetical protein HIM_08421 [Hirsutella minnesotensis 3608]|uniref:Ketoreductase domain-containing protein n=1 Tax=Hirsutella minnesotensis 3608 TaxID=1043627 RepID=A0A0F7ZH76_9HYPO|nr:hypothetical protein HIM_08421 [Hirsutella minnesotensis 3608]